MKDLQLTVFEPAELDSIRWDTFVRRSPQGSLFVQHGYASAIRPDWQAMVVHQGEEWWAVMPFCLNRKWSFRYLPQPAFAQYWGVCFADWPTLSPYQALSRKRAILDCMLAEWKSFHLIIQNFSPAFDYPLPFHWADFELRTRYTYQLPLQAPDALWAGLAPPLQRQIRKGQRAEWVIRASSDPASLMRLLKLNQAEGRDLLGSASQQAEPILARLLAYLTEYHQGGILEACDEDGEVIGAGIFADFLSQSIYLLGAFHPEARQKGVGAWLIWSAIERAHMQGSELFDFEGSMIKGVEGFFRKFGAQPIPYVQIYKNQLPLPIRWMQG